MYYTLDFVLFIVRSALVIVVKLVSALCMLQSVRQRSRYRMCIRCYINYCRLFTVFYLLCTGHILLLRLQSPNKDQQVEQLFYYPFVQVL